MTGPEGTASTAGVWAYRDGSPGRALQESRAVGNPVGGSGAVWQEGMQCPVEGSHTRDTSDSSENQKVHVSYSHDDENTEEGLECRG